jgi:hypothetical protein
MFFGEIWFLQIFFADHNRQIRRNRFTIRVDFTRTVDEAEKNLPDLKTSPRLERETDGSWSICSNVGVLEETT